MQQNKYNLIADDLEQRIANGEFTHRLPPTRQLAQEYQVSKRTFDKAAKRLKTAGFILPGARGTLINQEHLPRKRLNVIALVFEKTSNTSAKSGNLITTLQQLTAACNYTLQMITLDKVKNFPADGFIFFGCYDHKLAEYLHKNGIAAVSFNMQADNSPMSYVDLSYSDALIRSINRLTGKGITRIAFYHPMSQSPESFANWKKLYAEFIQERQAFMLKLPELDFFIPHRGNSGLEFVDFLRRQKNFPQVILQLNWHSELFEALQERNIVPGKECSLMSLVICKKIMQNWTTAVWNLLQERMHNAYAPPTHKRLPVKGEFIECTSLDELSAILQSS
jgi:DNA-binding LacI/PurR family transcriptional regulator